jgi:hypothetical protein
MKRIGLIFVFIILLKGTAMPNEYTRFFGNSSHNSCMTGKVNAKGTIAWLSKIPHSEDPPSLLLTANDRFVVCGLDKISVFNSQGKYLWERSKKGGSQVVIEEMVLYLIPGEVVGKMVGVTLDNKPVLNETEIPGLDAYSSLALFEPNKNGLIGQIFSRDSKGNVSQTIFKTKYGLLGWYEWYSENSFGSIPIIPIVSFKGNLLFTSNPLNKVLAFDINNKNLKIRNTKPVLEFPFPLQQKTQWLSLDEQGNLCWCGNDDETLKIAITDASGKIVTSIEQKYFSQMEAHPISPILISSQMMFVLTKRKLVAYMNHKFGWEYSSNDFDFSSATAISDGSVLVVKDSHLIHIDKNGVEKNNINVKTKIATNPVIDDKGWIYICDGSNLIAIN